MAQLADVTTEKLRLASPTQIDQNRWGVYVKCFGAAAP